MQFLKALRPRVRSGEITSSVRIWRSPHVGVGKRYAMDGGWIEIDAVREISIEGISPGMARDSGFNGLVDLLKTAKHGQGTRGFLIRFHYISAEETWSAQPDARPRKRAAPVFRSGPRSV